MGGRKALEGFGPGDHELLVKIVKETQRRGSAGSKGPWKAFLATLPREDSAKPIQNDPARRDWETLSAFCATLVADADVNLVQRMRDWHAWLREEERLEKEDPFPLSPEQGLVAKTRQHPTYKQGYDLPAYQEGWALSKRGAVADAPSRTRVLSVDCEMCKAEGNAKELICLSVVDQDLKVLLSEFVKPTVKVLDYRTEITGASAESLKKVTYTHSDAQKAVLKLLSEPGTILVGHGLQHDLRALKIDHRRVIDTSLVFGYAGLPTAIPSLGDLCRAVLEVGFREGGPEQAHDSIEDAKIPMRLVLHEMRNGPTPPLAVPDVKVDKSELSKLFLHKISKGTPREDLARAFAADLGAHVQMVTWGASGTGTTFALFRNPEVANKAFKSLVGREHKDALGRAQKSVSVLPAADNPEGQKVSFTVRKMGCHNGAAFGVKGKGVKSADGAVEATTADVEADVKNEVREAVSGKVRKEKKGKKKAKKGTVNEGVNGKTAGQESGLGEKEEKSGLEKKETALHEDGKKAKKQGKSSAERRKAKRALKRVGMAAPENTGVNEDTAKTGSLHGKGTRSSKKHEVNGEKEKASERRREEEPTKVESRSLGKHSKRRRTSEVGGDKSTKKRRVSEGGEVPRHRRQSLDGHLERSGKRKRSKGEDWKEKRARKSEAPSTQQTLLEIQKLIASVAGRSEPNGKASSGKKSRGSKERGHRSESKSEVKSARKEKVRSASGHSAEKAKGGSEKKLKRELEERNGQVAALTKLVWEMAKGKTPT